MAKIESGAKAIITYGLYFTITSRHHTGNCSVKSGKSSFSKGKVGVGKDTGIGVGVSLIAFGLKIKISFNLHILKVSKTLRIS